MTKKAGLSRIPSLRAVPFLKPDSTIQPMRLSDRQREQLMQIATRLRLEPRRTIYREGAAADWVFTIAEGAVKSYRDLPSGRRVVSAFLFARDLFGLAENGRYVTSVQTITRSTIYRLPMDALAKLLKCDGDMQFKFLAKVTHELRESQRRAILINRRDAAGRLAMFVSHMAARQESPADRPRDVALPMTRSDVAGFLGLSLETVSRAARELEQKGIVKFEGRHLATVLDRARLTRLASRV